MDPESTTELLTPESKNHLSSAGTWARVLGILGFICAAVMVCIALMMMLGGSFLTKMMPQSSEQEIPGGFMGGVSIFVGLLYLVIGAIYFLISWWIYRFGNEIKEGLHTHSPEFITSAFNNLKNYFQAFGILNLIAVSFMLMGILGVLLAGFF